MIAFARYCLPQVFFYGMFVLVGQVLNARGRFGPMMWAPIANNVVSVAVLTTYLSRFGPADRAPRSCGGFTAGAEVLLGLGSTLGIVVQFLVLLPYLKAAGFSYRPRFDFRGTGLGHTLRLGVWTVLFVVVNQVAYTVVVRLASSGTVDRPARGGDGHRLHDLLQRVPADDGPALDHHGVAGHRDAAAALVVRRRRATSPAVGTLGLRRRCGRRTPWSCPFAAAARR